jgi:type II/IV secretion system protein
MSKQPDLKLLRDVIFFVDKLEDDFTFYLDTASHAESIKEIKTLLPGLETDDDAKRRFSLSEQITLTNIIPTGSIPDFWSLLRSPKDERWCYLLRKLEAAAQNENEKNLLKCLSDTTPLSEETQRGLGQLLVKALSKNLTDLEAEPWVKTLNLTDAKLGVADQRVPMRSLFQAVYPELNWQDQQARALICLSYSGKCLSVSVRKQTKSVGYEPKDLPSSREEREKFLFTVSEYCQSIYEPLFDSPESEPNVHGLLVITGPTKSLKSEITRALIHSYLKKKREEGRRPHLVTFEDPIERLYTNLDERGSLYVALTPGKELAETSYTPRQKQRDAGFLHDALTDALRQTPAVFFVGETRSKEEWEVLLDFAATGHLIVTTAHAGSLVEAMRKIFEARRVKTPADRGEIANKLLAVVNLKPSQFEVEAREKPTDVVFPALWRRTARGVAGLTSDGLSALLPHRHAPELPSCLGRTWFIDKLVEVAQKASDDTPQFEQSVKDDIRKLFESVKPKARKQACTWDLRGV